MAYPELSDYGNTSEGLSKVFEYVAEPSLYNGFPLFFPLMLFSLFMIVLLGNIFSTKRLEGRARWSSSAAVAGWLTFVVASFLSLIGNGLIGISTLSFTLIIAVLSTLWLLLTKE